ncbi:MAG: hypothetical protein HZB65_01270 [Candidatus Aenigmarchaeota archaeon]|nr:hypothetical protein [Candidatus Aenigmarchaeota archaeon]
MMKNISAEGMQFHEDEMVQEMDEYFGNILDKAMRTGSLPEGAERSSFLTRYRMLIQDAHKLHEDMYNYFKRT